VALAASTPWADQIAQQRDGIAQIVGSHFQTAQHIHRQAHCRANPDHPAAQAFMASIIGSEG